MARNNSLVVANWKMNTTISDAQIMGQAIKNGLERIDHIKVIIAPPFTWLYPLSEIFANHPLKHLSLAAQNINENVEGAFTGEISVEMIKPFARNILLGHSERRQFGETSKIINEKVLLALRYNLAPIIFVGEEKKDLNPGRVVDQAKLLTSRVEKKDFEKIVLVYEPIWAISNSDSSEPASSVEIEKTTRAIKDYFGDEVRLLYGGSVNKDNIHELIDIDSIDGVVVGAESLKINHFLEICQAVAGK